MQTQAVIDHIVSWLADYSAASHTGGFAVGVSGGVDSALSSTLCARTGRPVVALNMPIHQSREELDRAAEHIAWLKGSHTNVQDCTLELTQVYQALVAALPDTAREPLALANTRSRLRMVALYAVAGSRGLLVAGTGNKVEDFGVGFYTKYGDGGVDLSPIADLAKTQVYECARQLGIVTSILDAAPTDGLWSDGRDDEQQIGATYPELEWAMELVASGKGDEGLSARQRKVLEIYRGFHSANRHKMLAIPVCEIPPPLLRS